MLKIIKYLTILLCLFLLCSCDFDNNNFSNENIIENKEKKANENEVTKEEKKVLKICDDNYFDYLNIIAEKITKESKYFDRVNVRKRYPYIVVTYYPSKIIDSKIFNKEVNKIHERMFEELIKNDYSSKCGLKYDYNYINVEFYNFDNKKDKSPDYQVFKQFDVLKVSKYKSFEEYINYKGEK